MYVELINCLAEVTLARCNDLFELLRPQVYFAGQIHRRREDYLFATATVDRIQLRRLLRFTYVKLARTRVPAPAMSASTQTRHP